MRKIISTFLILSILFSSIGFLYAEENCKYTSQIKECLEANKNGSPLAIEDFLCISEIDDEKIIYNIILDDKFKKIDKQADLYLENLEKNKSRFFGENQKEPYFRGVDEIYEAFGIGGHFYDIYHSELLKVTDETINCLSGKKTSIDEVKDYFFSSKLVNNLIEDKLSRRKKVAFDIMMLNKQQVRKDSSKKFMQIRRTLYDTVSNLLMVNLGYFTKIMFKWVSKTKNPL